MEEVTIKGANKWKEKRPALKSKRSGCEAIDTLAAFHEG